jgi:addiction module HigA family antidote
MFNPCHPGELLREEMGDQVTVTALAKHLGVTRAHLSMILNGRANVSPLMSLKLDQAFNKSEGFWLRVQHGYDLAQARRIKRPKIRPIRPTRSVKAA